MYKCDITCPLPPPSVTNCHTFSDPLSLSSVTYFMDGPKVNTTECHHQQAATFWLLGRPTVTLICDLGQKQKILFLLCNEIFKPCVSFTVHSARKLPLSDCWRISCSAGNQGSALFCLNFRVRASRLSTQRFESIIAILLTFSV